MHGAHAAEDADLSFQTVTVTASRSSGTTAASAGDVTQEQLASQPLLRPAAILENVPGLIVTQHSGEGKAAMARSTGCAGSLGMRKVCAFSHARMRTSGGLMLECCPASTRCRSCGRASASWATRSA
jgi:hypothetical protein